MDSVFITVHSKQVVHKFSWECTCGFMFKKGSQEDNICYSLELSAWKPKIIDLIPIIKLNYASS